jgi:hypothetical protein
MRGSADAWLIWGDKTTIAVRKAIPDHEDRTKWSARMTGKWIYPFVPGPIDLGKHEIIAQFKAWRSDIPEQELSHFLDEVWS